MLALDKKIIKEMDEDIVDSVFTDEFGNCIDSLAGLECDEDIIIRCLGGKCDE